MTTEHQTWTWSRKQERERDRGRIGWEGYGEINESEVTECVWSTMRKITDDCDLLKISMKLKVKSWFENLPIQIHKHSKEFANLSSFFHLSLTLYRLHFSPTECEREIFLFNIFVQLKKVETMITVKFELDVNSCIIHCIWSSAFCNNLHNFTL